LVRILIADDQPAVREVLREFLVSFPADFSVIGEAGNGQQAVDLTFRENPDVVLMDIRMPLMDGLEATRLIKSRAHPALIITHTSFPSDELTRLAYRAGAVHHLRKPFDFDDLRRKIVSLVEKHRGPLPLAGA
jgi:DNA-binding NarL/FixJ family response regulator